MRIEPVLCCLRAWYELERDGWVQRGLKAALEAKRIDDGQYRARMKPVAEPMLREAARGGRDDEVQARPLTADAAWVHELGC